MVFQTLRKSKSFSEALVQLIKNFENIHFPLICSEVCLNETMKEGFSQVSQRLCEVAYLILYCLLV